MKKKPLISIVVITYNSSKYVLETLESAKAQTYQNIELIVTDDCSTDNTVEICKNWIEDNKDRFLRTELITVEKNTGIAPNCNRGYKAAKGEWIKVIAGDDLLFPECIQEYVEYSSKNDEKLILSGILPFSDNTEYPPVFFCKKWSKSNAKSQLRLLLKGAVASGSTFFIERLVFEELKGFDETYTMIEDYPFAIKYTKHGYRIGCINKALIKYRKNPNSVTHSGNNFFSKSFFDFFWNEAYPEMKKQGLYLYYWHYFLYKNVIMSNLPLWLKRLTYLVNPVGFYMNLKKLSDDS